MTAETTIIYVRITAAGTDENSLSLLNTRYSNTADTPQQFKQAVYFVAPAQFPGLEAVNSARAWIQHIASNSSSARDSI